MNTNIRRVFVAPNFLRFKEHDYGFQMMQLWISWSHQYSNYSSMNISDATPNS